MPEKFKGVELTLPLSDEVRQWLLSKGKDTLVARLDMQTVVQGLHRKPAPEVTKDSAPVTQDSNEDEEIPPYWEWSKSELVEELKARGLDTSGRKEELVARLEEDDASGEA